MKTASNYVNKILNFITTIIIILLFISVVASFQTTFFGKKYNSFFGYALFEIKTASMAGEMEIGDWILVKVTNDVELNDIITFEQDGSFITHRIIEQYKDTYVTKGDSNNAKDTPITKEQIIGKLVKVMPRFGIIKKTFFNHKVLIVLIITIIVGTSLFDNKNKNKINIINTKKLKKENKIPKKEEIFDFEEFDNLEKLSKINDETIEQIDEKIIETTKQQEDGNQDISKTMVLSKIVVDMNSKTLSSISKHLENTTNIEPITEEKVKESNINKTKVVQTNKTILLGKNDKNLIKKAISLKENEINELIKVLIDRDNIEGEFKKIINKFTDFYIEQKYINQGELNKTTTLTTFKKNNSNNIVLFANSIVDDKNNESYKKKVNIVANIFLIINKLDSGSNEIEKVIEESKIITFENPKKVTKEVKRIIRQFETNLNQFYKKLETSKFELLVKSVTKDNLYKTNISSSIQFNKLFSDYSIDKTYNDEVIMEDLRELQLKMLSLQILKDMFEFSYKKKYLIYINDTIYKKEKKLKSILGNIDDIYSQGKINILLDIKTVILNYSLISELSKNGYHFAIQLDIEDLNELKNIYKYLCIGEYIFIKNNKLTSEEISDKIPQDLENKIINIDKSLLEGPVIR